ncbi:MAG: hypothetical protein JNM14_03580 [Ferruginibacter sp.]|nr:hypothetical protein [Ferruginibacter sp.]
MEIKYLTYRQIDKTKWDDCIDRADNGLIYAYSFYLDAMAKNWDALVLGDYEAVMPLAWNKKYNIHYLYQPPFTACLGVFGRLKPRQRLQNLMAVDHNQLTAETVNAFLQAVPPKYKYWDIYFNPGNLFKLQDFALYERINYVLNLNNSYENLYNSYRDNIKRNIKKSEQYQLSINKNITIAGVIKLAKEQPNNSTLTVADFNGFEKLFEFLYSRQKATAYGAYTKEGRLIASAAFFFSHKRAYYIMVGNHPDGKTLGASHALINAFIKDHAGEDMLLDFEGSDIPSLAFFYSSFGAVEEKYSAVKLNKLPAPLKWLKK